MKALVTHADGQVELVDDMPNGSALTWLQTTVGGYIEGIGGYVGDAEWMAYCDEEGKMKSKPINAVATRLAHLAGWPVGDVLCGTVVFVGLDADGDNADVPDSLVALGNDAGLWVK